MPGHFSSPTRQRYVSFFTMQRSVKNIISSKVNIFFFMIYISIVNNEKVMNIFFMMYLIFLGARF